MQRIGIAGARVLLRRSGADHRSTSTQSELLEAEAEAQVPHADPIDGPGLPTVPASG